MLRLAPSLLILLAAGCGTDPDQRRPSLRVLSPADAGQGPAALPVRLVARVDDGEASLVQVSVVVTSDVDGRLCNRAPGTTGKVVCSATLSEGEHVLTFVAEDGSGNKRESSITWTATAAAEVDLDGDGVLASEGDCDDSDAAISPLAEEVANGIDDNCDGVIDEGTSAYDDDGDGYSEDEGDCDDADPSINPGAAELADGIDQNCDGQIDEGTDTDDDGDGFSELDGDCDDTDGTIFPGAFEGLNGVDDDCDGLIDEGTAAFDDDGDGFSELEGDCDDADPAAAPDLVEVDDGIDNDCDGEIDEPDGAWTGTLDLVLDGGLVSTCTGLMDLTVDRSGEPHILGTATCESTDATLSALSLSGTVDEFGDWAGVLNLTLDGEGPFDLDWAATAGTAGMDGTVAGTATTTAYGDVLFSGSFAVER